MAQCANRTSGETGVAAVYLGMGDTTHALQALERAAERRESFLGVEVAHPAFDDPAEPPLHRDLARLSS